ncbi:MAG: hypothetical protein AABW65_02640 [Nanoarchaeota archaeon]
MALEHILQRIKKEFIKAAIILPLAFTIPGCSVGINYRVTYRPNVIPSDFSINTTNKTIYKYDQEDRIIEIDKRYIGGREYFNVTDKMKNKEFIMEFPPLIIEKFGYNSLIINPEPIKLKKEDFHSSDDWPGDKIVNVRGSKLIKLEKDPDNPGPIGEISNYLVLTVNSEPVGARIYEKGFYVGEAPVKIERRMGHLSYKSKKINFGTFIAVKDGYLPSVEKIELETNPEWKYGINGRFNYANLFLLKRDTNSLALEKRNLELERIALENNKASSQQNITIKQEKDALDYLKQIGEIGTIIKTLQYLK